MPTGGWEGIPPERLTPRQRRLQRCARILLLGALVNLLAVIAIAAVAVHAGNHDSALFTALQEALLPRLLVPADAAVLLLGVMTGANVAALLVLSITILAQEWWALAVLWLWMALNLAMLVLFGFAAGVLAIVPLILGWRHSAGRFSRLSHQPCHAQGTARDGCAARADSPLSPSSLTLMGFFTLLLYLLQIPQGGVVVNGRAGAGALHRRALH